MKKKRTLKTIRNFCLKCGEEGAKSVRECDMEDCPFYPLRFGRSAKKKKGEKSYTATVAIKAFCLYCMNGQKSLVKSCDFDICPLHLGVKKGG